MTPSDLDELKAKAQRGSVVAQSILGIGYLHGIDLPVDLEEAFRLLSSASAHGASRAMLNLAHMHHRGLGTTKNIPEAVRLYEKAATRGEFLAQLELARLYARGADVPRDEVEAAKWYAAVVAQKGEVTEPEAVAEGEAFLMGGRA
jgi:TPR repeat protein